MGFGVREIKCVIDLFVLFNFFFFNLVSMLRPRLGTYCSSSSKSQIVFYYTLVETRNESKQGLEYISDTNA